MDFLWREFLWGVWGVLGIPVTGLLLCATYKIIVELKLQGGYVYWRDFKNFLRQYHKQSHDVTVLLTPLNDQVRSFAPFISAIDLMINSSAYVRGSGFGQRSREILQHAAIMVYGKVYDFSENGLTVFYIDDNDTPWEHVRAGKTKKTEAQFEKWLKKMMNSKLTCDNYCVLTFNCVHFASKACTFLSVPVPKEIDIILEWINSFWGMILTRLFGSSGASSGSSGGLSSSSANI